MSNSNLLAKAEQLEASAAQLRDQASKAETKDCGCDVAAAVAGQVAKTAAVGVLAATTGIVLPTL